MTTSIPRAGLAGLALLLPAAAVQAQVTIYGVADVFLQQARSAESLTRVTSSGHTASRLGLRGEEDLGDGHKALFVLETGPNLDTGSVAQGGVFWGRQSYVGLKGPWGQITLGRQYTSLGVTASVAFSAFANGAYGASTATIGGFGGYEPVRGSALSATGLGGPFRANNAVRYESPSFGGFTAGGLLALGETDSARRSRILDLFARYTAGALDVALSYVDDHNETAAGPDVRTLSASAAWRTGAWRWVGGILDVHDKRGGEMDGRGWWVGAEYRLGGAHLVRAQFLANDPKTADGDTRVLALGYQYDLSKRSALYGSVSRFDNQDRPRWNGPVPEGFTRPGDTDITELVVGVRHVF